MSSRSTRYGRPVAVPAGPFAAFGGSDVSYALDDGMPFPGWAPSLLTDAQAEAGYAAGERIAVIAGDPADPVAGLVLDTRNSRLAVRLAGPPCQLVYSGADLTLTEALWTDPEGRQCWARRVGAERLRVSRRPSGAWIWVEELLAYAPSSQDESPVWPVFGEWAALTSVAPPTWVQEDTLDLIDADGWMLDALEEAGVPTQWRELGRKYDAPRAFGLPAEVQVKLAEPLGWVAAGRRWRKSEQVAADDSAKSGALVVTDALFAAGAGASGEIVTTVTSGEVSVTVDLPTATPRVEAARGDTPGSPPRPSTGAQVAVTAILEAGGQAHDAVVSAVKAGRVPAQWPSVFG